MLSPRRCLLAVLLAVPLFTGALTSCSGGDDPEASPSESSTASPTSPTALSSPTSLGSSPGSSSSSSSTSSPGQRIEVTITGKKVSPSPATVKLRKGATLTLVVTSDHDDEIHAHGFEVEEELTAGVPTTLSLTGSEPGVYEVETHHPALTLMKIAVS